MKNSFSSFTKILLLIILFSFNCKREDSISEPKPLLRTNAVNLKNGISLSGDFILRGSYRNIQYGFLIDKSFSFDNPSVITAGSDKEPNRFSATANIALEQKCKYFIKSWAKTDKYEVFGNVIEFDVSESHINELPVIDRIIPENAAWNDTVMIIGKYLDPFGTGNKIFFNGLESEMIRCKTDTIWARVPYVAENTANVFVEVYKKRCEKGPVFQLALPSISGISSTGGQYPDTLTILGDNFSSYGTSVLVDNKETSIINVTKKTISFEVPFLKDDKLVKVELRRLTNNYKVIDNFHYYGQSFVKSFPNGAWIGDTTKLYAHNIDFRKINMNIKSGDRSLVITQKWKDSLSFIPQGDYKDLKFNYDLQFRKELPVSPYHIDKTVDQIEIPHRVPLLQNIEKNEFVYLEDIKWQSKGVYNSDPNYRGHIIRSIDGTKNLTNYQINLHFWGDGGKVEPGEYSLQLYSYTRFSNIKYFKVLEPRIDNITPVSSIWNDKLLITGVNLPKYTDYVFTHLQTGRTFTQSNWSIPNYDQTKEEINTRELTGSGDYQVGMKIGEKIYQYPGKIQFKDYFNFLIKTEEPLNCGSSMGFVIKDKLYVKDYKTSSVDLKTGKVGSQPHNYDLFGQPVFLDNKIYSLTNEGYRIKKIVVFNEITETWEIFNTEGIPNLDDVRRIGVYNSHLIAITFDGKVFQYNQKWNLLSVIQNFNFDLGNIIYRNGYLYLFNYNLEILVVSTSDWKIQRKIKVPNSYTSYLEFELNGNIYIWVVPAYASNTINLYKLTNEETFVEMTSKKLRSSYYQFCPDGHGNLYFMDGDYVYTFNP